MYFSASWNREGFTLFDVTLSSPSGPSCAETASCTSNCAPDSCRTRTTLKAGSPCWPPPSTTAAPASGRSRWTDGDVTPLSVRNSIEGFSMLLNCGFCFQHSFSPNNSFETQQRNFPPSTPTSLHPHFPPPTQPNSRSQWNWVDFLPSGSWLVCQAVTAGCAGQLWGWQTITGALMASQRNMSIRRLVRQGSRRDKAH